MGDLPLDKLWTWWKELASEQVKLRKQFEPLRDRLNQVEDKLRRLEDLIRVEEVEPEGSRKIVDAWGQIKAGEGMTLVARKPPDVAFDILIQVAKPMHYRKLVQKIEEQGVRVGGRDPGSTLIAYLGRDKRFTKAKQAGRGYYQLKEWENKKG
jgi:ERCC4-related helicase